MATETIKFELILHFEGTDGYSGSINGLKQEITRAIIRHIDEVQDIEIDQIERTKQ